MSACWDVLGIEPGSSETEIKRAYARLVRKYPPEGDAAAFQRVREAYESALVERSRPAITFEPTAEGFGAKIDWGSLFSNPFGFDSFAFRSGTEYAEKCTRARDTRPCPKCGAAVGEWCKSTTATLIHKERML